MKELNIVVYSFMFILLFLITIISYIHISINKRSRYLLKNRLNRINWWKFVKMFLTMFGILLLISIVNGNFYWYDSLIISAIISYILIIYIATGLEVTDDEKEYLNSKSFNRECKIDSILKKKIL